MTRFFYRKNLQ